jgi:hypothetical protein
MRTIKRGMFLLVILVFGLGAVSAALAGEDNTPSPLPASGTYSFVTVGSNVNALTDVPTTTLGGVFTVTRGTTDFTVSAGDFMLNFNKNICTGNFTGTGTPVASGITSGTMSLTLSNLSGSVCDILSDGGSTTPTTLTMYYSVASLGGNPDFSPSNSVIFVDVIDTNSVSVVGEAQKQ